MAALSEILHCKCAQFRDIRLKVDKDVFPVPPIVLAASSDYFYAMSRNGMEGSNRIERRKYHVKCFKDHLRILYSKMLL